MRTIMCAVCGKKLEVPDAARAQKYCPDCGKQVMREKQRIRDSKRHRGINAEKPAWYDLNTLDTPENVAICLDCRLKECRMGSAGCGRTWR